MEKNNKVFANKITKKISNNRNVFVSSAEIKDEIIEIVDINKKINDIFNSKNYVYKADVKIKIKDSWIEKTIIGKNRKYLITIENELIPISEIGDIKYK